MKGFITVADAATSDDRTNKVSALGAFWSTLADGTRDIDVIFVLRLNPDELGAHDVRIRLAPQDDSEGDPIAEIGASLTIEPTEDKGPMPSLPAVFSRTVRLSGTTLKPGLYSWSLQVDETLLDEWVFLVTEAVAQPDQPSA